MLSTIQKNFVFISPRQRTEKHTDITRYIQKIKFKIFNAIHRTISQLRNRNDSREHRTLLKTKSDIDNSRNVFELRSRTYDSVFKKLSASLCNQVHYYFIFISIDIKPEIVFFLLLR